MPLGYNRKNLGILASALLMLFLFSCRFDNLSELERGCYPREIADIMETSCAVSGCHNDKSYTAAGGLNLTTWDELFEGGSHNSIVIPYRPDQSLLLYFVNTDSTLGPTLEPTMPFEREPLTTAQVQILRDWILQGAPNCDDFVKFSDNPNRAKAYICNQGCDLVTVLDIESQLIMRYIGVGATASTEAPHNLRVSPDGQYWYVCFTAGSVFQKYRTMDDSFAGEVNIGFGSWNTFAISSDSKRAFIINWQSDGAIAVVDLESMTLLQKYQGSGLLQLPHGSALKDDSTLYVTANIGNFIYKVDVTDLENPVFEEIVLAPGESPTFVPKYDPHEIAFSPDGTQYAVSCQRSNELRFFNAANDSLIAAVPTGVFPQEITFSNSTDYVFVSCMEDDVTFSGNVGSVSVIDYKTHAFVKAINTGYQPHGIMVDDEGAQVLVANRNSNPNGPAPHHTSNCGGRNGYLTIIDMNTLDVKPGYRPELSVDPYFVAIRR